MKLAIIIPAFNESSVIGDVILSIPKILNGVAKFDIIVVNDGSKDDTAAVAKAAGTIVINHRINLGTGAATITGLEYAKRKRYDVIVTMDGDGQHDPKDLVKLIQPIIKKEADVVIGSRLINAKGMPLMKFFGNIMMNVFTFLLSHIWTTDSQSGFRAYRLGALEKMKIKTSGYEICSEVFAEIRRNNLKFKEIPIKVIYSDYSRVRGQSMANGINIVIKLLTRNLVK
jgi:glycosyltransferase involved in cell wall biosynthesis